MDQQIYLNQREKDYIQDQDFLLTKHTITDKIFSLLNRTQRGIQPVLDQYTHLIPEEVLTRAGKISKGENYRGLPYLILDHPRYFKKDATFAFRSMFWWGNFCSITFHLQGCWLELFRNSLKGSNSWKSYRNLYICINDTPWEYHFEQDNYRLLQNLSRSELNNLFAKKEFIKISEKIDLKDLQNLPEKASGFTKFCLQQLENE